MFMTALQWVNTAIIVVGIPTIVTTVILIGRKLEILDGLVKTTDKIKVNVKVVSDHLIKTSTDFDHKELQAYSPLRLTEEGKKLIKDLGFDNVFSEHKNDFFSFIDHDEPTLKYDVEAAAIKSVTAFTDNDYMEFLKKFLYNTPNRTLQNTAPTLGIYIRDKYLEEHPEITE